MALNLSKHRKKYSGSPWRDRQGHWQQCLFLVMLVVGTMLPQIASGETALDTVIQKINIAVTDKAQVLGDQICLSDVAAITGANSTLVRQLGDISLGKSPRPGKERRYSGNRIHALVRAILDTSLNATITIPDVVCVQRAHQRVSETSLKKAFESYVASRLGGVETSIRRFKIRGNNPLPLGNLSLAPVEPSKKPIKGATTLKMAVYVDGEDMGRLTLSGWVDRYEPVVCTSRFVSRGEILTEDDIVLKKINISQVSSRIVKDADHVVGKQVKSNLRAGRAVQENFLVLPPMIEKGERVRILAISGGIQVATLGIAMDEGREGEQIKVENITSKKLVVGRVSDRSTVEVLF